MAIHTMEEFRAYRGKGPLIAAHKGRHAGLIGENTLKAFELALRDGADILETDLCMTADGEIIVMHGPLLDHYTTGTGNVRDNSLAQIRELRNRTDNGSTTACEILTLDDLLEEFKDRCLINLDRGFRFLQEAFEVVRAHGMEEQILLKSPRPSPGALQWLKESGAHFMPIIKSCGELVEVLRMFKNAPLPAIELVFEDDMNPMLDDEWIDRCHSRGTKLWVNALTLNFPLAGYHDDMCSLFDDPDKGWGWLYDRKLDILQTDFVREAQEYFTSRLDW